MGGGDATIEFNTRGGFFLLPDFEDASAMETAVVQQLPTIVPTLFPSLSPNTGAFEHGDNALVINVQTAPNSGNAGVVFTGFARWIHTDTAEFVYS